MARNVYLFYAANNRLWRHFPNAVLALANPLREAGFNPVIIDTQLQDWRTIPIVDPLFCGFSIYTESTIATVLAIASELKGRFPAVKYAWGGPHVIMLPEQTAQHPLVDFACYGEGEAAVVALARAIDEGRNDFHDVPGIVWKRDGIPVKNPPAGYTDMDAVTLYPFDLLDEGIYSLKHGKMYYEASRGCPFQCAFCSYDHTKWRPRSASAVVRDLAEIEARFAPAEIQISDANHFMNAQWVEEIWRKKKEKGLAFVWETNCRFDLLARLKDDTLRLIKESGCYQLRLGAESGSQKILDYLNKGIKVDQIISGVERCRRHGINALLSFMTGYPAEDDADVEATTRLIDTLRRRFPGIHINGMFQFVPYPNTKIYQDLLKEYPIPQPKSLDEWGRYHMNEVHRTDFPWLDERKFRRTIVLNSITSYVFFSNKLLTMPAAQRRHLPVFRWGVALVLFRMMNWFIHATVINLRWKRKFMLFPLEWHFWNLIRQKILKLF